MKREFDVVIFSIKSDRSGVPVYCAALGKWLESIGKSVCIVTRERGPAFEELPVGVTVLEFHSLINSMSLSAISSARAVLKIIDSQYCCNLFILNGALFGTVGRFQSRTLVSRSIFVHHGVAFDQGFRLFRRLAFFVVEVFLLNFTQATSVAVSTRNFEQLKNLALPRARDRIHLISNVSFRAGLQKWRGLSSVESDQNGLVRYICVAGFRSQKNHLRLFDAFEKCGVESELFLLGIDVDSSEAVGIARERLSSKKFNLVSFVGVASDPNSFFTSKSIAVLASDYEGFPLAALEAAQIGAPVVMTPVSGSDELQNSSAGFIANRFSAEDLALTMEEAAHALTSGNWDHRAVATNAKRAFDVAKFFESWQTLLFRK